MLPEFTALPPHPISLSVHWISLFLILSDGDGNLCWQAAFEQEIASLAVGIRSFPKEGLNAEKFLRDAYIAQLTRLGGQVCYHLRQGVPPERFKIIRDVTYNHIVPRSFNSRRLRSPHTRYRPPHVDSSIHSCPHHHCGFVHQVEKGGVIVDFGCGVGTSTRLLAEAMPDARRVIGMDLSPYMIAVGNHHNREKKIGRKVSLLYGDVADTRLPDGSASLVSCTYLLHEMPDEAVR